MSTVTPQDLVQAVRTGELSAVIARLQSVGNSKPADLGLGLAMACFLGYRDIVRELVRRGALLNLPPGLTDVSPLAMAIKGKQRKTTRLLIALGAKIPPGMETGLTQEELDEANTLARRRAASKKSERRITAPSPDSPARRTSDLPTPHRPAAPSPAPAPRPSAPQAHRPAPAPVAPSPPRSQPPAAARPAPARPALSSLDFTFPAVEKPPAAQPAATAPAPLAAPPMPPMPSATRGSRGGIVEEIQMTACYGVDTNVLEGDLVRWNPDSPAHDSAHDDAPLNTPELVIDRKRDPRKR